MKPPTQYIGADGNFVTYDEFNPTKGQLDKIISELAKLTGIRFFLYGEDDSYGLLGEGQNDYPVTISIGTALTKKELYCQVWMMIKGYNLANNGEELKCLT